MFKKYLTYDEMKEIDAVTKVPSLRRIIDAHTCEKALFIVATLNRTIVTKLVIIDEANDYIIRNIKDGTEMKLDPKTLSDFHVIGKGKKGEVYVECTESRNGQRIACVMKPHMCATRVKFDNAQNTYVPVRSMICKSSTSEDDFKNEQFDWICAQ